MRRARPGLLLCGLLLALATGCLGAVASLYPPAEDAPAELVWVVDHGWHTGLVMARSSIPRGLLPEQNDFPVARYLEVGWGDADFYRARDPGLALAIRAAIASRASVVHVVGLPMRPEQIFAARDVVEIRLSRPGFEALARFVDDGFDREGHRRAPRLGGRLHGASAFYPARGRYHLLNTCNTWIARALRAAGVPITPVYAMTAGNLMWQVKRLQASPRGRSSIGSRPPLAGCHDPAEGAGAAAAGESFRAPRRGVEPARQQSGRGGAGDASGQGCRVVGDGASRRDDVRVRDRDLLHRVDEARHGCAAVPA